MTLIVARVPSLPKKLTNGLPVHLELPKKLTNGRRAGTGPRFGGAALS